MFTILNFVCIIGLFFYSRRFKSALNGKDWLCLLALILLFTVIYFNQALTIGRISNSEYFPLVSADSERYLSEILRFDSVLSLNELLGTYVSVDGLYVSTPKMGLSGYVAAVSSFGGEGIEWGYFLLLTLVLLIYLVKIYVIRLSFPGFRFQNFFILALIFFPFDFYWYFRFLREPVANGLFELALLTLIAMRFGHFDKVHKRVPHFLYMVLVVCIGWLLLWRAQLSLVIILSSIFVFRKTSPSSVIFYLLSLIAVFSTILASGVGVFRINETAFAMAQWIQYNITELGIFAGVLVITCYILMWFRLFSRPDFSLHGIWFFLAILLPVFFGLIRDFQQIRFVYPLILGFKVVVLSWIFVRMNRN
ncbi:hypothetical protein CBF45_09300 [Bordetella sp. J329]|nr:hypothetical protein CBF45_09300 [Bordetella sp. J329]